MVQKQGPTQIDICDGCTSLVTHDGTHQSHHICEQKAWPSIKQTQPGEVVRTPRSCPFRLTSG